MPSARSSVKPDQKQAADQLQILQELMRQWGKEFVYQNCIWILRKNTIDTSNANPEFNRRLVPFKMNPMQLDMSRTYDQRNITLKMRQGGATTFHVIDRLYVPAILEPGTSSLLISQTQKYGVQHFGILHRVHRLFAKVNPNNDQDPANEFWIQLHQHLLHTAYSPRAELVFDMLDSRILVDTSENTEVGQGLPGISHLVATELSRWSHNPEETMANVTESVHPKGTIDIECTPNGMGGYFFEEWDRAEKGESVYKHHFYQWWYEPEYFADPIEEQTITEEEAELRRLFKLSLEQIGWRRMKIKALRHEFAEKYPEDAVSCFLTQGSLFFDAKILHQRMIQILDGKDEDGRYKYRPEAEPYAYSQDRSFIMWKRRNKLHRYLIGADPATGRLVNNTDTDYCAACVVNIDTGEQMATFHARIPPEEFALVLRDMAQAYNDATIAVERTGDGGSVMLRLSDIGYANVYSHRQWDRVNKQVIELPGWPATTVTRPIACNRLAEYVREYSELIHDPLSIKEMMSFIREAKKGKPEASVGAHDDSVSAMYIAHYCRLAVMGYLDPISHIRERYGQTDAEETA